MSTEIKVGDRRIFRSKTAREIEIVEQLAEDPYAGEFRYRYTDALGGTGILPAENLEMSTRPAPSDPPTQDHGPLAAHLSDRTLAKVLSRPAYVPSSPTKDAIVEAALRWHAIRNANAEDVAPLALFDADDALHTAVKAHIAAVVS